MSTHDDDHGAQPLSWPVLAQRIAMAVVGAVVIGTGSMLIADNTKVQIHEQRLMRLESALEKLPDIDKNVMILSGKLDVLNQKLDDARDARAVRESK